MKHFSCSADLNKLFLRKKYGKASISGDVLRSEQGVCTVIVNNCNAVIGKSKQGKLVSVMLKTCLYDFLLKPVQLIL